MKKKFLAILSSLLLATSFMTTVQAAEKNSAEVYVTVADENGNLSLAYEKITVTDNDNDGALTVKDA